MSALTFTLKSAPAGRLSLAQLTPERLKGKSERDIAGIIIGGAGEKVAVGDAFKIAMGDADDIRIAGANGRLDDIGANLSGGTLTVEGHAGGYAGRSMSGGTLTIKGDAGPWLGAAMSGGKIELSGTAGDRAGAALPGDIKGMRGGTIVIRGGAGARAGDGMRRGLILIEGLAGRYLGSRMIAGTVIAMGGAGAYPGYMMRRGTVIFDGAAPELAPSFTDCGRQELTILRLIARELAAHGAPRHTARLAAPVRRFAGDMAVLGKGELLHCLPA
jgi:formylmethanofuran dehydrogenase subunit C